MNTQTTTQNTQTMNRTAERAEPTPVARGLDNPLWEHVRAGALRVLPRGGALPVESWRSRHRGITMLLWAHVVVLPLVAVLRGESPAQGLLGAAVVGVFAVGASLGGFSLTARSAMATIGLVTCSAILVHYFAGLIEMHFHYFVIVAVVALYQAWRPYLLALSFIVLQHASIGILAPHQVYDHMDAQMHPWTWALIHGGFVLAESIACLMYWRISEDALDREREARGGFEKAHQDLAQAQALSSVGSWDWDLSTDRVSWSDQLYTLTGLDRKGFVPSVAAFVDLVHPEDRERVEDLMAKAVTDESGLDYESRLVRADGQTLVIHALVERTETADGLVRMIGTIHDVTEWKALHAEIERLAFHDPLTGLANRRLFLDRLEHALASKRRSLQGCAVLFMDLDDFKKINDVLGHSAGDELLRVVAERLMASVRPADTVARLGGDEFAILLEGVDIQASTRLAERLEAELRKPIQLQGAERSIRGSIGIAMAEGDISADDILRNADAAMYAVKVGGKNSHKTFPSTLSSS
jgi:diguanylate cyclase (GGDEF)-like protein/PAS domain S-box-containing protein